MSSENIPQNARPPYWLGLICIIPIVGVFVGFGLLFYGLIKYKDKLLTIIGASGILWTFIVYYLLYYVATNTSTAKQNFEQMSQFQLNNLIKNIEYYNILHGHYPDSLSQLLIDDKSTLIYDMLQVNDSGEMATFNYEKVGDKYTLFSSGKDGIPKTSDDLFPHVVVTDSSKFGFMKLN